MKNTQVNTVSGSPLCAQPKNKTRPGHKQGGYSLTELSIVILVIALLAALIALVLPGILAGVRAGKITDAFNSAIPAIQTAYQNRTSYTGLTTAQVAQNRWMGTSMTEVTNGAPTGNLVTQWGQLTFAPASNGTQAQGTLTNVPQLECIKIVSALSGDQYLNVSVGGTAVKSGTTDLDLTAAGTQCNASNANTIVFTFGRA
ncbi:type 4 pilus major pilin [Pseudomonas syringae group genomosp. 3]|uniref:type 4 pilus major pilin n=1 Tax=Pseudomonas syringae group genomosp. 3 TaxID=251701 RepID=UPI0010686258|nr:type 4 pilus major pilin [Pseudomonas syringae group genomosp. 3]TES72609.1 prepilin-type N-terminal cleavage/methylation domain-containing protein [Pseudomonas syringae pv. tomato]